MWYTGRYAITTSASDAGYETLGWIYDGNCSFRLA